MANIFIAGRHIEKKSESFKGKEKTITIENSWQILGAFSKRKKAEANCYDDKCFVLPMPFDMVLPIEIREWHGVYYPKKNSNT